MHIKAETLYDLMRQVLDKSRGDRNTASKGPSRELLSVLLTIANPRARFSRTESRATLFSCLGETLWHLSGSDRLDFIEYYIPNYREFADLPAHVVLSDGAYGPRLRGTKDDQIRKVIDLLKSRPSTRRAVIQIFGNGDREKCDTPCTCTLQFMARRGVLHMMTNMRSNDAFIGLPHDVFAFTMIHELVARSTGHELGLYNHAVGSLHVYEKTNLRRSSTYQRPGRVKSLCLQCQSGTHGLLLTGLSTLRLRLDEVATNSPLKRG
jgi:thymidylate synthase